MQRSTTRLVPAKTYEQLDLQALHRVWSRLVGIRGFLLERGITVRQGLRFLRQALPDILAKRNDVLSPHVVPIVADFGLVLTQRPSKIGASRSHLLNPCPLTCRFPPPEPESVYTGFDGNVGDDDNLP